MPFQATLPCSGLEAGLRVVVTADKYRIMTVREAINALRGRLIGAYQIAVWDGVSDDIRWPANGTMVVTEFSVFWTFSDTVGSQARATDPIPLTALAAHFAKGPHVEPDTTH